MRWLACLPLVAAACARPAPPPIANAPDAQTAAGSTAAALAPVITAPHASACPLQWDALDEIAPARIALQPMPAPGAALPDDCPPDFEPARLLAAPCADCDQGELARGRHAVLEVVGPDGSGRFVGLGLAVDGPTPGFACATASTVGWRHLYPVADQLAPLPWLADVAPAHAGVEWIAWHRLPWGDSELDNALVPVVYALDGDTLVRRDDHARALAHRVAAAYATLATTADPDQPLACYRALADILDRWGE